MKNSYLNNLISGTTLSDIYDFVDHGNPEETPERIVAYLDLMDKVRSMDNRRAQYGTKESVLNHLIKVENLTRHIATKVYYNALEYFYISAELSKQAQRNLYAAQIDRHIAIAEIASTGVKDEKMIVEMIKQAFLVRGLDKEDIEKIPESWFKEQIVLYDTSALKAGIDPINRLELAKNIDDLPQVSEKVKAELRREALIDPLILFANESENVRKNQ